MDNIKNFEVEDIRQSVGWKNYLEFLGWNCEFTKRGVLVANKKIWKWSVAKVQRPKVLTREDIEEIEAICKKNNALFVKVEPNQKQNLAILTHSGYKESSFPLTPPSTIYIDLKQSEGQLQNKLSDSAKYSLNRAKREGVKVEFYKNPKNEIVEILHKAHKETAGKKGFTAPSLMDIKKKVEIFGENSFIAVAKNQKDEITNANLFLANENAVWYIHGGTTKKAKKSKAGYLLYWESFLYFGGLGFEILDLEGRYDQRFPNFTKSWKGFSEFKKKFGGSEIEFPAPFVKVFSKSLNLLVKTSGNRL